VVHREVGEKRFDFRFAEVVRVDPLPGPLPVEAEEIDDSRGLALLGGVGVAHGPAGGGDLFEQFHG